MKLSSTKNISRKIGLPPGSLVHIGERPAEPPSISIVKYSRESIIEQWAKSATECKDYIEPGSVTWINVNGLSNVKLIDNLCTSLGIHKLITEDILNTSHRSKMDDLDSYMSIIIKLLKYNISDSSIENEQISIIIGKNFVLSFLEKKSDTFQGIKKRLQNPDSRIRNMGADYLIYSIIDTIVDNYFYIIEKIGDHIENIEEYIFDGAGNSILSEIHSLKRDMIFLKKSLWPLREILSLLQKGESSLISMETSMYFKDVYEHIIQVLDTMESLKDVLSGMTELFISISGNRMNEIMKVLTIMSTIFIPLTFIAGIYGMNFKHMPELEMAWFYPWFLYSLMASIIAAMISFFKWKKWF